MCFLHLYFKCSTVIVHCPLFPVCYLSFLFMSLFYLHIILFANRNSSLIYLFFVIHAYCPKVICHNFPWSIVLFALFPNYSLFFLSFNLFMPILISVLCTICSLSYFFFVLYGRCHIFPCLICPLSYLSLFVHCTICPLYYLSIVLFVYCPISPLYYLSIVLLVHCHIGLLSYWSIVLFVHCTLCPLS